MAKSKQEQHRDAAKNKIKHPLSATPEKPVSQITAIDLFSGAGGFSFGAISSGINIVGALEFNPLAATTYKNNISSLDGRDVPLIEKSIMDVEPPEAMQYWGITPATCDIVIGGPPCQGFSTHRIADSGIDDPRNELLCRYFEYVSAIRPRVFLVENVPGLLWPRHATYLKRFYSMAEAANYEMKQPVILNARDYGVPQNRKRVFLLGIDSRRPIQIVWPPAPTHVDPALPDEQKKGRQAWRTASEVFSPAPDGDQNDIHMNHSRELITQFETTPRNGGSRHQSNRVLACHVNHSGHRDVYGRIDPTKPGPTMTTACINPSKGRFVHPVENHGITVRQAARFQTFPDNYTFFGGLMASGAQIGNAVPVALGSALLKEIAEAIKASANNKD